MSEHDILRIRDARDDERDALRNVTLAAFEEYGTIMPQPLWVLYRRQILTTLDAAGPAERIVAERNSAIVGSALLYRPGAQAYGSTAGRVDEPQVRLLAVLPAARGEGVGLALMTECARRARRAGATTLGLHTMDMMQAATRMYERMGFVRAPDLDFSPAEGVLVKAYRLDLMG
jgi:GNAT superfamily N-acetyltransferase